MCHISITLIWNDCCQVKGPGVAYFEDNLSGEHSSFSSFKLKLFITGQKFKK
jgi:hypothetical protein